MQFREPIKNKVLQTSFFIKEKLHILWPISKKYVSRNFILLLAVFSALITCFFVPFDKEYLGYFDYKTLSCLLSLMLITRGMTHIKLFKMLAMKILERISSVRLLSVLIVFLPSIFAVFITNDVAILTFAPFAMVLLKIANKRDLTAKLMILQILACNLSGILSPIGTAQNLYLYEFYGLNPFYFVANLYPLAIAGYFILFIAAIWTPKDSIHPIPMNKRKMPIPQIIIYCVLFVLTLLAVFKIIPYYVTLALVVITLLLMDRKIFRKTNYNLLVMFMALFVVVGNITRIPTINTFLQEIIVGNEFFLAIGLSQVITNTSTALLLPQFTTNYYPLIMGLGVGKFGTMLASMSSFMAYNMFTVKYNKQRRDFLKKLIFYNTLLLLVLGSVGYIMVNFIA